MTFHHPITVYAENFVFANAVGAHCVIATDDTWISAYDTLLEQLGVGESYADTGSWLKKIMKGYTQLT